MFDPSSSPDKNISKKSKGLPWHLVAVLALFLGIVAGQAMVKVGARAEEVPPPLEPGTGGSSYPEELRKSFLDGCVGSAERNVGRTDAQEMCKCVLKKLEDAYSLDDFVTIVSRIQNEALPPTLQSLISECVRGSGED